MNQITVNRFILASDYGAGEIFIGIIFFILFIAFLVFIRRILPRFLTKKFEQAVYKDQIQRGRMTASQTSIFTSSRKREEILRRLATNVIVTGDVSTLVPVLYIQQSTDNLIIYAWGNRLLGDHFRAEVRLSEEEGITQGVFTLLEWKESASGLIMGHQQLEKLRQQVGSVFENSGRPLSAPPKFRENSLTWNCAFCGNVNPSAVAICKCGKKRSETKALEEPMSYINGPFWKCAFCGNVNPSAVAICKCGKKKAESRVIQKESSESLSPGENSSDWYCAFCGAINASQRLVCKCGKKKSETMSINEPMSNKNNPFWKCAFCGNVNPSTFAICKCGKKKAESRNKIAQES